MQWGFMLDDPRMTNSTFIEGYATDGTLHYPPYTEDARVSHAHGWATGPTSALTFYVAGIQLLSPVGKTWRIAPALGGLQSVDSGFETTLGVFSSNVAVGTDGCLEMEFQAPKGTSGSVVLPAMHCSGSTRLRSHDHSGRTAHFTVEARQSKEIVGLKGGRYSLEHKCE
jgi:hypothetical protein